MCSKALSCPCLLTIQMTIITRDLSQLLGAEHEAGRYSASYCAVPIHWNHAHCSTSLCLGYNILLPLALVRHAGLDDIQGGLILAEVIWHVSIRVDSK